MADIRHLCNVGWSFDGTGFKLPVIGMIRGDVLYREWVAWGCDTWADGATWECDVFNIHGEPQSLSPTVTATVAELSGRPVAVFALDAGTPDLARGAWPFCIKDTTRNLTRFVGVIRVEECND